MVEYRAALSQPTWTWLSAGNWGLLILAQHLGPNPNIANCLVPQEPRKEFLLTKHETRDVLFWQLRDANSRRAEVAVRCPSAATSYNSVGCRWAVVWSEGKSRRMWRHVVGLVDHFNVGRILKSEAPEGSVLVEQLVALGHDRNELASAARAYAGVDAARFGAAVVAWFHLHPRNRHVAFEHV